MPAGSGRGPPRSPDTTQHAYMCTFQIHTQAHVFTLQKGRARRNTTTQNKASVVLIISAAHFLYIDSFNPGNHPRSGTIVPSSDEGTEAPRGKVTSPRVTWLPRGRAGTGTQAVCVATCTT